jgi:hypothetical protein
VSIATYTELKAAVASWAKRDDLTSTIPDLITLGEERLKRDLKLLQMETTSAVTLTSGNNYATLPTGFIDWIEFHYDADLHEPNFLNIQELERRRTSSTYRPEHFSISGRIEFESAADATYAMTMRHYTVWNIASTSTNWLLTNHPSAYLFTALAEAEPFLKNDKRVALWEAKAKAAIDAINGVDIRVRSKAPLRVDDGLLASGGDLDINLG